MGEIPSGNVLSGRSGSGGSHCSFVSGCCNLSVLKVYQLSLSALLVTVQLTGSSFEKATIIPLATLANQGMDLAYKIPLRSLRVAFLARLQNQAYRPRLRNFVHLDATTAERQCLFRIACLVMPTYSTKLGCYKSTRNRKGWAYTKVAIRCSQKGILIRLVCCRAGSKSSIDEPMILP